MRIGVLADTHGLLGPAEKALALMGALDLLLHAGDHYRDARELARRVLFPVHAVVGNCDPRAAGPGEEILELAGQRVLLTHGHRYAVHFAAQRIVYAARETRATVVVFGHTHVPYCEVYQGILLFNPGSIAHPRGRHPSYGVLEVAKGQVTPHIGYL